MFYKRMCLPMASFFCHLTSSLASVYQEVPHHPRELSRYVAHDFSTSLDTHGMSVVVVAWLLTYSEDLSHSWSSSCLIDVVAAYNTLQHTNCFALACHRYTSCPRPTSFAHAQCARIAISACPPYKCINPYR